MSPGDRVGSVLDERYEITAAIGQGAMAEVYRATDLRDLREVAVKVLRQSVARDHDARARFSREAEVQRMVSHRNVAAIYGSGVTPTGEPYLVVELLRGQTVRHRIKEQGAVELVAAASYAWQTLQGLHAVHSLGILHRDLKPANLMLEPSPGPVERVVLIDFGFASFEGSKKLTAQGHVVGSLKYMAPERLMGETTDERADLYAVGVILYELLAGVAPFTGADDLALIEGHLYNEAAPLTAHPAAAHTPAALTAAIARALAKDADDRFSSASDMADAIADAMLDV